MRSTFLIAALALASCSLDKHANRDATARAAAPVESGGPFAAVDASTPAIFDVAVNAHGFVPSRFEVKPLQPVILRLTRSSDETCADAIDVQGDPQRHPLPLGQMVEVRFQAPQSGQVTFACPMNMFHGAAIVMR